MNLRTFAYCVLMAFGGALTGCETMRAVDDKIVEMRGLDTHDSPKAVRRIVENITITMPISEVRHRLATLKSESDSEVTLHPRDTSLLDAGGSYDPGFIVRAANNTVFRSYRPGSDRIANGCSTECGVRIDLKAQANSTTFAQIAYYGDGDVPGFANRMRSLLQQILGVRTEEE